MATSTPSEEGISVDLDIDGMPVQHARTSEEVLVDESSVRFGDDHIACIDFRRKFWLDNMRMKSLKGVFTAHAEAFFVSGRTSVGWEGRKVDDE